MVSVEVVVKILIHNPNARDRRRGMMFTDVIHFKISINPESEEHNLELNSICEWVVETFSDNWVVLEFMDRRIAGGWGEMSKQGWEDAGREVDRSDNPYIDYYELRCYAKDATLFLLRYS